MMTVIITKTIEINSKAENDMVDITHQTLKAILESKLEDGIVTIFVSGSKLKHSETHSSALTSRK